MISIVTAYYNRKVLFERTLQSIDRQIKEFGLSVEVIAVDDGSKEEERLEDLVVKYPFLKIIYLNPKDKWYKNSCIPFNIGFKEAKGDKIIIQNPECYHLGNILEYTEKNLVENEYLSFGCYSLDKNVTDNLEYFLSDKKIFNLIQDNDYIVKFDGDLGWYNHSLHRPLALHFCCSISKKILAKLRGFDERFALGIAYDDDEFIDRVKNYLSIEFVDTEIVLHQNHYKPDSLSYAQNPEKKDLMAKNLDILTNRFTRLNYNDLLSFFSGQSKKKLIRLILYVENKMRYAINVGNYILGKINKLVQ